MKRPLGNIVLAAIGLSFAYFIVSFSLRLAGIRIYQVDECQNVFVAALVASGQAHNYFASVTLFVVPLAWLIRGAAHSIDMFTSARLVSLLIFWLNLLFIATATGSRLLSRRWLIALMGAATLAPLWDYGFEIRHDNLLLTGLLLSWCLVRFPPVGILSYTVVGALATAMQFTAFKAFVYTLPLTLVVLALPPIGSRIARWKLASAWTAGAVAMFLVIRLAYGAAGIWDVYLAGVKWASTISTGGTRFGPWGTLSRLLTQTPLLLALLPAAAITLGMELYHQGKSALTWEGNLPEALLFLLALGVLIINPAPHPYNLLNLVPFAYLFTFRYASTIVPAIWDSLAMRPLVLGVLLFAHVVPFWIATRRHLNWPNYNQEAIMRLAEDLTDPARDQVYDGIGMVPTRRSSGYSWFLHSLNLQYFIDGSRSRVREMLAEKPASGPTGCPRKIMISSANAMFPWRTISGCWVKYFLPEAVILKSSMPGVTAYPRSTDPILWEPSTRKCRNRMRRKKRGALRAPWTASR